MANPELAWLSLHRVAQQEVLHCPTGVALGQRDMLQVRDLKAPSVTLLNPVGVATITLAGVGHWRKMGAGREPLELWGLPDALDTRATDKAKPNK